MLRRILVHGLAVPVTLCFLSGTTDLLAQAGADEGAGIEAKREPAGVALPVLELPELQPGNAPETAPAAAGREDNPDEDDMSIDSVEPDFTVVTMPTTLRLPRYKAAFRVTHRFARPLGQGDFGDLVEDFFGFDSGAQIGLEFRFAPARGAQIGFYRTSDRTIQFFGQYNLVRQRNGAPLALAVVAGMEGVDNFREHRVPTVGLVVSRKLGDRLALYVAPLWLREPGEDIHVAGEPHEHQVENNFVGGVGGRLRLSSSTYLVGEIVPRLDSKAVLKHHLSFGLEKGVGGHAFQLNFSNGVGTTFAQVSRGANNYDDWFIGFNISRKFY